MTRCVVVDFGKYTRKPTATCAMVYPDDRHVITVLGDGKTVPAHAQDADEYRERAMAYGYRDDPGRMNVDHELFHSLAGIIVWGRLDSYVLWQVGHDEPRDPTTRDLEEWCCENMHLHVNGLPHEQDWVDWMASNSYDRFALLRSARMVRQDVWKDL